MDLEIDYIEYGLQTALSVIAMSLLLLVEPGDYSTYVFGLGLPLLFGHTAFISDEGFNKASLASIIVLVYVPIGLFMAGMAAMIFICNNFISIFTSDNGFRAHYSSTAIPLIMTGLVVGVGISGFILLNPSFESELESSIVDLGTETTLASIDAAGLAGESQEEDMEHFVNNTVKSTEAYVLQSYVENAQNPERQVLQNSFDGVENEIIQSLQQEQSQENMMEQQVSQMIESFIEEKLMILAIPLSIMILYALQPILGLLTAIAGKLFTTAGRHI